MADYTTCLPTNKTGVAYMTASAGGFTSNQVAVYSHPPLTSISIQGPTNGSTGAPQCLSQGQTKALDATAYCSSTGTTGSCSSPTVPAYSMETILARAGDLEHAKESIDLIEKEFEYVRLALEHEKPACAA